jgi:hypothetical protein
MNKFDLAEPFIRRAAWGFERTLGPEHPRTVLCVENLRVMLTTIKREKGRKGK